MRPATIRPCRLKASSVDLLSNLELGSKSSLHSEPRHKHCMDLHVKTLNKVSLTGSDYLLKIISRHVRNRFRVVCGVNIDLFNYLSLSTMHAWKGRVPN